MKNADRQKFSKDWYRNGKPATLDLDGHLFSGWQHPKRNLVLERFAPDFTSWEQDKAKFEAQFERVVKALQTKQFRQRTRLSPKLKMKG